MEAILEGKSIETADDVHHQLRFALDFGDYYGYNFSALWDRLSTDVPRPIKIRWKDSDISRQRLGDKFDKFIGVFEEMREYEKFDAARFDYVLE